MAARRAAESDGSLMAFKKTPSLYESLPRAQTDCAYAPVCGHPALVKARTKTGWANLCLGHYTSQRQGQGIDYADENGLKSSRDHVEHMKALLLQPKESRAWMERPKSALAAQWAEQILSRKMKHVEHEEPEVETVNF
jgi:hypothetical protein